MKALDQKWTLYEKGRFPGEELADLVHEIGESSLLNSPGVQHELVRLMSNPDELVRHNALGALAYHGVAVDWQDIFGKQLLSAMDIMLRLDEDRDCRRQAAAAFGSLFNCSKHSGVISALGRVCANPAEEDDVRAFAYVSLLKVACIPRVAQPSPAGFKLSPIDLSHASELIAKFTTGDRP